MKEITSKLFDLLAICEQRVKKCEIDSGNNAVQAQINDVTKRDLANLEKELAKKSKRLKDLQNIYDAEQALAGIEDRVKSELAKIDKARIEFSEYRSIEDGKLATREGELKRRLEKVEESERKIAEDKKIFRAKIIEDVHREMALRKGGF